MNVYRLLVFRQGSLLGTFEPHGIVGRHTLDDLKALFPEESGLSVEVQRLEGERRILESAPDGIRVLCTERIFEIGSSHG